MDWHIKRLNELSPIVLHSILKLRGEIFVVEQNCAYLDPCEKDLDSFHIYAELDNVVIAYTRLVDPGICYKTPAIGRVAVSQKFRGTGLGKELMNQSINYSKTIFPKQSITISAQCYLEKFYTEIGFNKTSEIYLEDNIPHIKMILYT
jgi:ElaA protein